MAGCVGRCWWTQERERMENGSGVYGARRLEGSGPFICSGVGPNYIQREYAGRRKCTIFVEGARCSALLPRALEGETRRVMAGQLERDKI